MPESEEQAAEKAYWLEAMPRGFDPVDEIKAGRKRVAWVGDTLCAPAQMIRAKYQKHKQPKKARRLYREALLRYVRHTIDNVADTAVLITETRVIIGKREDLNQFLLSEEEVRREQGKVSGESEQAEPSPVQEAGEGTGEEGAGESDPG